MDAYFKYITDKEERISKKSHLESSLSQLDQLRNIIKPQLSQIDRYMGVKNQIVAHIQNDRNYNNLNNKISNTSNSLSSLDKGLKNFKRVLDNWSLEGSRALALKHEFLEHRNYCYETMQIEDISAASNRCYSLIEEEENLLKQLLDENKERRKKRNKRIGLGILGLWIAISLFFPWSFGRWVLVLLGASVFLWGRYRKDFRGLSEYWNYYWYSL